MHSPHAVIPHLKRAVMYMQRYVPGVDSAENVGWADAAREEFSRVLQVDATNEQALACMMALSFNMLRFEDAEAWARKLTAVNPSNRDSLYTLGVVSWINAWNRRMAMRLRQGMKRHDPGPIPDGEARAELRRQSRAGIDDGIQNLKRFW